MEKFVEGLQGLIAHNASALLSNTFATTVRGGGADAKRGTAQLQVFPWCGILGATVAEDLELLVKIPDKGAQSSAFGGVEPQQIFASNQTMRSGQIERKCRVCLAGIGPRGHSEGIELGWSTPILVERYIRNDKS